jgi:hypothetical protein
MIKQLVTNPCAVNCAVDFIGFYLNFVFDGVLLKAVQRSADNTTPNLTTHLRMAGIWLVLNLHHFLIFNQDLYLPSIPSPYLYPSGVFPVQINRGEHGYKGDNQ